MKGYLFGIDIALIFSDSCRNNHIFTKGGSMICSPCMDCPNKMMPKDRCLDKCAKLQQVQDLQIRLRPEILSYAVDYSEEVNVVVNTKGYL